MHVPFPDGVGNGVGTGVGSGVGAGTGVGAGDGGPPHDAWHSLTQVAKSSGGHWSMHADKDPPGHSRVDRNNWAATPGTIVAANFAMLAKIPDG